MNDVVRVAPTGRRYRVADVAKSEALKLVTLRSTAITLTFTVAAALLSTVLAAITDLHHQPGWYAGFDPTQEALTGLIVAVLTAGVFGALAITAEYSSGTIRSTLAASPRRPALLVGKIAVIATASVAFCELLSFASFGLGQAILSGGGAPHASIGSPAALRAVTMTGVFVALLALMSFGFGLVFRSSAGAIGAFAGVVFVLQIVMRGVAPQDLRFTPTSMLFNSISATVSRAGAGLNPVSADIALALMALYAAMALTVGALLFTKRDA